jgi:hypothetical protein
LQFEFPPFPNPEPLRRAVVNNKLFEDLGKEIQGVQKVPCPSHLDALDFSHGS